MCGIAGFVSEEGNPADSGLLRRMCDRIVHRGPDAYGSYVDARAALGHRRLSIIDLSTGGQPQANEDGTVQVIFNGEIYNYAGLREDLIAKGHRFTTHSDTEVLVHLYEEVGERLPEYLNGMFAFAIWDSRKRELFLARDRFGKKPLYYTEAIRGFRLAFASELKALTAIGEFQPEVDPRAVADFLAFGYVPDPATIYRGVHKLPPAHSLLLTANGVKIRRYWDLKFAPDGSRRYEDTAEEIRQLAIDAVKCRLMSDVPLGAFLSGGVDSSAVVALMSEQTRVRSFSIGFTDKSVDELEYARLVVERYKTEHREQIVTPSIEEMLSTLVEHYDEPFGDSSAIPTLYLCRMTRQHVTVSLSGDGADELFGGYDRYQLGVLENRLRSLFPDWFRHTALAALGKAWPRTDFLPRPLRFKSMLTCVSQEIADGYFTSVTAFRDESLDAVLSPDLRRQLAGYTAREGFRKQFEGLEHLPALDQMQAVDIKTYLPGDILVKMDRASMAYSLEARAPWLDYRLGELAATLPQSFKVRGANGKLVFKSALSRYLPERTATRRKQGFIVPMAQWMRTSLRPVFESSVFRPAMESILDLGETRRLWEQHQGGMLDNSTRLWYVLMLACWHAHHGPGASRAELAESLAR